MELSNWPRSIIEQAFKAALESPVLEDGNTEEEAAREFREFVESVSVSREEMEVLVSMPELTSIHAARQYLQEEHPGALQNQSSLAAQPWIE